MKSFQRTFNRTVVCALFLTMGWFGVSTLSAQVQATLEGHAAWVASVAISPCGQMVASGDGDGEIRLWDLRSCELRTTLLGHSAAVDCLAFSPDNGLLATGTGARVRLDVASNLFPFRPKSATLAMKKEYAIRVWDTKSGSELITMKGHTSSVRGLAFSADGNMLASASTDKSVKLWNLAKRLKTGVNKRGR